MDNKEKQKRNDEFFENALTPNPSRTYDVQSQIMTKAIWGKKYDPSTYDKFKKVMGLIITIIIAFIILVTVFFLNRPNKSVSILVDNEKFLYKYDIEFDMFGKIWDSEQTFAGTYGDIIDYGNLTGRPAQIARAINKFSVDFVVCSDEYMKLLAENGYLTDPEVYLERVKDKNILERGVALTETGIKYGLSVNGSMDFAMFKGSYSIEVGDYIGITVRAGKIGSKRAKDIQVFLKHFYKD